MQFDKAALDKIEQDLDIQAVEAALRGDTAVPVDIRTMSALVTMARVAAGLGADPESLALAAVLGERSYQRAKFLDELAPDASRAPALTQGQLVELIGKYARQCEEIQLADGAGTLRPIPVVQHKMRVIASLAVKCMAAYGVFTRPPG